MATARSNQSPRASAAASVTTLIALTLAVHMVVGVAAIEAQFAREASVERQSVRRISAGVVRVIRDLTAREAPAVRTDARLLAQFDAAPVLALAPAIDLQPNPSPPAAWLLDLPPPTC